MIRITASIVQWFYFGGWQKIYFVISEHNALSIGKFNCWYFSMIRKSDGYWQIWGKEVRNPVHQWNSFRPSYFCIVTRNRQVFRHLLIDQLSQQANITFRTLFRWSSKLLRTVYCDLDGFSLFILKLMGGSGCHFLYHMT